jgi:hypothetical protein
MSIEIIVIFLNFLKNKFIVFGGKMKDKLPKRDQIFFLLPYLVFSATKKPFKKDEM